MRKLEEGVCEMKRLFVRDGFHGQSIGVQLIEKLIEEARKEKYTTMRLDTFPLMMAKAVSLYNLTAFARYRLTMTILTTASCSWNCRCKTALAIYQGRNTFNIRGREHAFDPSKSLA
jgi:Acetyltransferase (GNAT) family.